MSNTFCRVSKAVELLLELVQFTSRVDPIEEPDLRKAGTQVELSAYLRFLCFPKASVHSQG